MRCCKDQEDRNSCAPTFVCHPALRGVDIKIISELLGHSSTEITYRIYVHVIDSLKEMAVEALDLD